MPRTPAIGVAEQRPSSRPMNPRLQPSSALRWGTMGTRDCQAHETRRARAPIVLAKRKVSARLYAKPP
jgi:hypothetical protein